MALPTSYLLDTGLGSWLLKVGPIGCTEMWARSYRYSLRTNAEEHGSLLDTGFVSVAWCLPASRSRLSEALPLIIPSWREEVHCFLCLYSCVPPCSFWYLSWKQYFCHKWRRITKLKMQSQCWSRDSIVVSTVTRQRAGRFRVSNPGRFKWSPRHPDRVWGPPNLIIQSDTGPLSCGVKGPEREADHAPSI